MKGRKCTSKQKFQIVLEGMKGTVPLAELCGKYEIHQTQYYKWRDQLLNKGEKAFETALAQWINSYNTDFPHQALAYSVPSEFYKNFTELYTSQIS